MLSHIKNLQDNSSYVFQAILNVLENDIESLHISMSLDTNTRGISMLFFATELFLLCIPVLQCKLVVIIDGTFQFFYLGRLLQTINIRNLKVK